MRNDEKTINDETMLVYISGDKKEALKIKSIRMKTSLSDIVRQLVDAFLDGKIDLDSLKEEDKQKV